MISQYTTKTSVNKRYKILYDRKFTVNRNHNGAKFMKLIKKYGKTGRTVDYADTVETPINYKY
jgi:hypothetical protein